MKNINSEEQLLKILEALSNPTRLRIISALIEEKQYVSELSRQLEISRPLLYLHLQRLEDAKLIKSTMEISKTGKALKYFILNSFHFELNEKLIHGLISSNNEENKGDF